MAEQVLTDTLALLAWRLQRLEFLLSAPGSGLQTEGTGTNGTIMSIPTRIRRLEQALRQLCGQSETAQVLLKLNAQHPSLFDPSSSHTSTTSTTPSQSQGTAIPEPTTAEKLSLLTSEAPSITTTASQLRHLSDIPIPASSTFTKVINLQPRIEAAASRQAEQALAISELRKRSARLVVRWHEGVVLGQGRCWADWETRVRGVEVGVRRQEVAREDS